MKRFAAAGLSLALVFPALLLGACDVFVPDKGDLGQTCLGDVSSGWVCKDKLTCDESMDPPTCVPTGKICEPNGRLDEGEDCDPISGEIAGAQTCSYFEDFVGGELRCAPGCLLDFSGCNYCGNNQLDEEEDCDINAYPEGVEDCADVPGTNYLGGPLACGDDCRFDLSGCAGCGNGEIDEELGEECDTLGPVFSQNMDSCEQLGFLGGELACDSDCRLDRSNCHNCGDGFIGEGEQCEEDDIPFADCQAYNPVAFGSGSLSCNADCSLNFDDCEGCGNGRIDAGSDEQCDPNGPVFAAGYGLCTDHGFMGGEMGCNSDCSANTDNCHNCGNATIDIGEDCDPTAAPTVSAGLSCANEGFFAGSLACNSDCTLNTDNCHNCGNGSINEGEACDGNLFDSGSNLCAALEGENYLDGTLTCNADCTLNLENCTACGNGVIDSELGEICDGEQLDGASCQGEGFDSGDIACAADCKSLDTSACIGCGDGEVLGEEECEPGLDPLSMSCTALGFPDDYEIEVPCNEQCRWNRVGCDTTFRPIEPGVDCVPPLELSWAPSAGGQARLLIACASTRIELWSMDEGDPLATPSRIRETAQLESNTLLRGACLLGGADRLVVLLDEAGSFYLDDRSWNGSAWEGSGPIESYVGHNPDRLRCALIDGHALAAVMETGVDYAKLYDIDQSAARLITPLANAVDLALSASLDSSNLGQLAVATDGTGGRAGVEMWNLQANIGDTAAATNYLMEIPAHATALCPDGSAWAIAHEEDPTSSTFTLYPSVQNPYNSWYGVSHSYGQGLYGALACRPDGSHDFFGVDRAAGSDSVLRLHPGGNPSYQGHAPCGPASDHVRMAFSPDGRWLATWVAGDEGANGLRVRIWDADALRSLLAN